MTLDLHDYGPGIIRNRDGRWVSSGRAGETVIEDREDPSYDLNSAAHRPVVHGARRWDAMSALRDEGVITNRQLAASNQWLNDLSAATCGSYASFLSERVSGNEREGLSPRQRAAMATCRKVSLMFNLNQQSAKTSVLWRVVIDNWTPLQWAKECRIDQSRTPYDWLRRDLDRLDDFYNPVAARKVTLYTSFSAC